MRDLVALSALPAVWAGYQPRQVAEGLADVLLKMLHLDLVYLRLRGQTAGQEIEIFCTSGPPTTTEQVRDLSKALAPWLEGSRSNSTPSIPNPVGRGTVHLVIDPIGCDGNDGLLIAGSQQPGFPTEEDCLLLSVGANQAAAVIQRQRAEEALRESEQRFRGTFENAAVGIAHFDVSGRFLRVNEKLCDIVGYTREEVLAKTFQDITYAEDLEADLELFMRLVRGDVPSTSRDKRYVRKDGSPIWVAVTVSLQRDAAGRPLNTISVIRDVTARKRLEGELRHAKEVAEAANRAKDEFLANVSHEIRTPMNAILGMTELALETPLTEDQRQCLKTVKSAADNLLGIINDLLDFSKIEAGKLELDSAEFSLRSALSDTLRALAMRAHKKGLELVSHVAQNVPDALVGDAGRLRQVLLNLIGNAIKFTERGEVVVSVKSEIRNPKSETNSKSQEENPKRSSEAVSGLGNSNFDFVSDFGFRDSDLSEEVPLRFEVTDTGIGIPTDKQGKIFRAFEQEDTSTT